MHIVTLCIGMWFVGILGAFFYLHFLLVPTAPHPGGTTWVGRDSNSHFGYPPGSVKTSLLQVLRPDGTPHLSFV